MVDGGCLLIVACCLLVVGCFVLFRVVCRLSVVVSDLLLVVCCVSFSL